MNQKRRSTQETSVPRKRFRFFLDHVKLPEITSEGVLLATGNGDVGQLGLGPDVLERLRPTLVNDLGDEIVNIYAGGMHSVCLTKEGKILTFGCNDEGALGRVTDGTEDAEFTAGEVELPGKVIQVSAGDSHTAALLEDGRVFAWGTFRDSHGSMGFSINGNERLPYQMMIKHKVLKIASGADHIVFLTEVGEVYTCGCGEQGQLGRTCQRFSDRGSRYGIERLINPSPIKLKAHVDWHCDNIWATTYGTLVKIANKNDVYAFGLNNYHQLGLPDAEPQFCPKLSKEFSKYEWEDISGGQHHTLGLTTEGKVYSIGRKEYGRLGLGENCDDAKVLTEVSTLTNKHISNISGGASNSFAVSSDGTLHVWGMGTSGQLGLGDEDDRSEPTPVNSKLLGGRNVLRASCGGQHTLILCSNGNTKRVNGKHNGS